MYGGDVDTDEYAPPADAEDVDVDDVVVEEDVAGLELARGDIDIAVRLLDDEPDEGGKAGAVNAKLGDDDDDDDHDGTMAPAAAAGSIALVAVVAATEGGA